MRQLGISACKHFVCSGKVSNESKYISDMFVSGNKRVETEDPAETKKQVNPLTEVMKITLLTPTSHESGDTETVETDDTEPVETDIESYISDGPYGPGTRIEDINEDGIPCFLLLFIYHIHLYVGQVEDLNRSYHQASYHIIHKNHFN